MEVLNQYLCQYKGHIFVNGLITVEHIDSLQTFEIRESDIFLVTYPKSGTIWTQQILILLCEADLSKDMNNLERIPWLEYPRGHSNDASRPSPRLFTSHLTPALMPQGLKGRRAKIVYVMRNPKDVTVSFFYFCHIGAKLETPRSFEEFMEQFLEGRLPAASWFDHIREWYSKRVQYNILFVKYEDMIKDLRSEVLKISKFLGKNLDGLTLDRVVEKATFKNMKKDPKANYEFLPQEWFDREKGHFLRKGLVGDWKSIFTVAQNERFDCIFKERMRDIPLQFTWEITEHPE
ncbi:hypothetical protein GJAV_G00222580 [Gymnothorax javanicus]|nr:hypothetical protein GJAV_G00222580 [Gymnothorax javanicus]